MKNEKIWSYLCWAIVAIGSVLRIIIYLQNRNLFIDESNIARNIFEKGYAALAMPLAYEQYAPPVFLWILKLVTDIFGYSEYAFRVFPLAMGIGSLVLMVMVMKQLISYKSLWYPLGLFAVGFIFLRYSSELKQYMGDIFIGLSLILLALRNEQQHVKRGKFILLWVLAGSIAIWSSMPSVFILAGIGAYYFVASIKEKRFRDIVPLVIVYALWMAQFAFYFYTILKPQAETSYLQNFHEPYFLFWDVWNKDHLMHNWYVFKEILQESGGYSYTAWLFNSLLIIIGAVAIIKKSPARACLLIVPVLLTLLAAAMHKFSLIPRVTLFMMPLLLLLIGYGFAQLMNVRFVIWQLAIVLYGFMCIENFNMIKMAYEPWKMEELTEELAFLKERNIKGNQLYVHNGARPAFIYYTQIHPGREQWASLKDASLLSWDADYNALATQSPDTAAFIYTSLGFDELQGLKETVAKHKKLIDHKEDQSMRCYVYIYSNN